MDRIKFWLLYIHEVPQQTDKFPVFTIHQEIINSFVYYIFKILDVFLQPEVYKTIKNNIIRIIEIVHKTSDYHISSSDLEYTV
jgi:hypothetical protein